MKALLKNAYDLHVHIAPDVVKRRAFDNEIACAAKEAGMKGFVVKSHYSPTAGTAAFIRRTIPGCNAIGGIALNNSVGGLNPEAVEMNAGIGAKIVWLPTNDAKNMWTFLAANHLKAPYGSFRKSPDGVKQIALLEDGRLVDPIHDILDLIAANDMLLETGHVSPVEAIAVMREAKKRGVNRMLYTHADFPPVSATIEQLKDCIACGALIEFTYVTILDGDFTIDLLVDRIRSLGSEHIVLSSDLGQVENPFPTEGFATFLGLLVENGITEQEIERMVVRNTALLVE